MIPLKIHNVADYMIGALLLVSPWLFGFSDISAALIIFLISGVALIASSALTKYYFSIVQLMPLGVHMTVDTILGIFLILAPALMGYRDSLAEGQYVAHVVLGIAVVGLVALTQPRTEASRSPAPRSPIEPAPFAQFKS